ncbi:MAG: PIN domain-containing protein [Eubacterium sp.]|nr:PIN domain-containing protein [Eubacterium sp.]
MKNMAVLIDTNVLLNYITGRKDKFLNESIRIVELCALGKLNGYIAFHTLSTLWYVLRKKSDKERRDNLRDICTIFSVASASKTEIMDAIENVAFADFEDCLQDKCAREAGADYIITVNEKDFENSEIEAINSCEFLEKLK